MTDLPMTSPVVSWSLLALIAGAIIGYFITRRYFMEIIQKKRISDVIDYVGLRKEIIKLKGMSPILRTLMHDIEQAVKSIEEKIALSGDIEDIEDPEPPPKKDDD